MTTLRCRSPRLVADALRATGALVVTAAASAGFLLSSGVAHAVPVSNYNFETLNNVTDPTFNQLLGINRHGVIAGYFGSGAAGHPNMGYQLMAPYGQANYSAENFLGSTQTQATGLNDRGAEVGFWSPTDLGGGKDANYAWYSMDKGQTFSTFSVPGATLSNPPVTQLLGVNNTGTAVGFYTDAAGNSHGFSYNIYTHQFNQPSVPGASSWTESGVNNRGDVVGFFTSSASSVTESFLNTGHRVFTFAYPGASSTQAFGVNDSDEVVGVYTIGPAAHGFTWTKHGGFTTLDDPHGLGTTTLNGVNDAGDIVGFYVDAAGNTDGALITPAT